MAYASYRAVEGVVTPNGALHGTILEYSCNIGYRDTILPCLPSRQCSPPRCRGHKVAYNRTNESIEANFPYAIKNQ